MSALDHPKVREALERIRKEIEFARDMGWAPDTDPIEIQVTIHKPVDSINASVKFSASKLLDEKDPT
jgi:hypothetical protein